MDHRHLLDGLDPEQQRAVTTGSTLVAVIAGAGSGKTRVLTRRVAYGVVSGRALARHTLVLTFTREAAGELRRRLPALGLRERIEAGTFHSVMLGLLRQRWIDRGRPVPTVVQDRRRLVAAGWTDRSSRSGRGGLDEVVAEIDWAAARGVTPEAYVDAARAHGRRPSCGVQAVARALAAYRDTKRERGVIDLDDVLTLGIDALSADRAFAETVHWRYRHVLVDEAQDLNPLQHRLVELLAGGDDHDHDRVGDRDLFLVGDPAQAVYGFNGADPTLLVEVADRFPGIEIVRLETNHRNTAQVLDVGTHVLRAASIPATAVRASRGDGHPPRVLAAATEDDEAALVVRVLRGLDPDRLTDGRTAVLSRTHQQLGLLRAAIESAGLPVRRRLDGPGSPYREPIAAAVRQGSPGRLRAWAHDLLDGDDRDVTPRETLEVADAVLDFLREQPLGDGAALRSWIMTTDPFGTRDERGVDLLTFHAAKGREWHTAIVTGVETGLVPHRTASTAAARAEEARLLYVALTRASDELIVTWSQRRGGYARRRSPLLDGWEPSVAPVEPPPAALRRALPRSGPVDTVHAALVRWRAESARAAGILPDQLVTDTTLRTLAEDPPVSEDQLAERAGVGILTARRLFPGVAAAVASARAEPDADGTEGAGAWAARREVPSNSSGS